MKIITQALFLLFYFNSIFSSSAKEKDILIGILENHEDEEGQNFYNHKKYVRIAFTKNKNDWEKYIKLKKDKNGGFSKEIDINGKWYKYDLKNFHLYYPSEIKWNVFYKGRIIDNLSSISTPYPEPKGKYIDKDDVLSSCNIGIQKIKELDELRFKKEKYINKKAINSKYLVLSTKKNNQNKDIIKEFTPTTSEIQKAIDFLHKKMYFTKKGKEYKLKKSYQTNNGNIKIIILDMDTIEDDECSCGKEHPKWTINACIALINGKPKLIGKSNIEFIDAGDYDNNGKIEYLFKFDTGFVINYILFYDNFEKQIEFEVFSS
ncbi:MAG: hypothetical protein GY830_00240 [Bacteroidetes bacterium]|nr:hypothetical protein [Bacteroidota bacterium]